MTRLSPFEPGALRSSATHAARFKVTLRIRAPSGAGIKAWKEAIQIYPDWPTAMRKLGAIIRRVATPAEQAAIEPTIRLMEDGANPCDMKMRTWAAEDWYATVEMTLEKLES